MDFDIADQVNAIAREVRDGERDGAPTRVVVAARTYDTALDDLWDAVTTAERISRWMMPVSGDLRLGGRYQLEGNAGGEVVACEPPTSFAVTWEFGGDVTWLDVRLWADPEGGARLELAHSARPGPHWEQFGPGAVGIGWDLSLLGLWAHLAGQPRPEPGWEASPEAQELMRGSNDGWCAADIASGTPEDVARPAADRTIAAYTAAPEDESHHGSDPAGPTD